jgi:hypothetical protein
MNPNYGLFQQIHLQEQSPSVHSAHLQSLPQWSYMEFFLFIIHHQPWFPLEPGLVGSPPCILILCPSPTASRPHSLPPLLDSPYQSPGSNNENRCMLLRQRKSQVCWLPEGFNVGALHTDYWSHQVIYNGAAHLDCWESMFDTRQKRLIR